MSLRREGFLLMAMLVAPNVANAKPMKADAKHRACATDDDCTSFRFDCGTGCNTCGSPVSKSWLAHYEDKAAKLCKAKKTEEVCDAESCSKKPFCVKKLCLLR